MLLDYFLAGRGVGAALVVTTTLLLQWWLEP
jgi:hypothetical protein